MNYRTDIAYAMGHRSFAIMRDVCNIVTNIQNTKESFKPEFKYTTIVENNRNSELILCMEAIILYQIFMEAIVNDIISENDIFDDVDINNTKLYPFSKKWEVVIKRFNASDDIKSIMDNYLEIYRQYRNKLVHPKDRKEIKNRKNIRFYNVYIWMKCGWDIYEFVSLKLGTPHTKDSWNTMASIYNLIPFEAIEMYKDIALESIESYLYTNILKSDRGEI